MAQTIQVDPNSPGCYVNLAEAIAEAPTGSTIRIAAGEYPESIRLDSKVLTLEGEPLAEGGDEQPSLTTRIVGGGGWAPIVEQTGGELTLRHLAVNAADADAVKVVEGTLTVESSVFTARSGNALRISDGSTFSGRDVTLENSQVGLVVEDAEGELIDALIREIGDDGVVVRLGASPTLRNCKIANVGGRGIYVYESAKPVVEGCEITGSRAEGIAIAQGGAPTLNLCKVIGAGSSGIRFGPGTGGQLRNCTTERCSTPEIDIAEDADVERIDTNAKSAGLGAVEAPKGDPQRVESLLAELDGMVGLQGVKAEVRSIIDEIQVNEWRRAAGLSVGGMSNHLIFAGAPGTGKTTVGRIYGQLLAALGALPGGPLKEVSRRDLVGQYVGHTAEKTAAVFDEAKGGVVFLDEAYTLTRQAGGGSNDFGQEAVDMIVKLMEDMRKDIAVIAAGYTHEMRDFLDANPGLASRFVKTIEFENYDADDLTKIITGMITSNDYAIADDAVGLLRDYFERIPRDENFGNARDARKLFEKLRKVQSGRLRQLASRPELSELITITSADVQEATSTP
ncbi:right-handed parallel beta-helix repeat-containing protein [Cumulibacter soli]|uniref:right-handed parallel beta-helix repeat-containing protein n=1 Tax=Cumulibacter soli TaxID=2546344 RepID=UPI001067C95E|nr:right-handed parallel beta-helix repeat-containing protein [Cumulibacter soli]